MIRRLQITRLFGIQGNTKQVVCDKNLTIIVGINGSGKTTILNMLHALLTCSFRALSRYDFECIEQSSCNYYSSTMLIIVENWNIADFFKLSLYFKTSRSCNIFQIYTAKAS